MISIDELGKIVEVGENIKTQGIAVEYYEGALCPGFINTHCHLELSHLKDKVEEKTGLSGFIQNLQKVRTASEDEIQTAIQAAIFEMKQSGIVGVGDISNGESSINNKESSDLYYHTFVELFAFDPKRSEEAIQRGKELQRKFEEKGISASIVPHSPYSVSRKLFEQIADAAGKGPLSIHNQETASENEMYQKGTGNMVEMLRQFDVDLSTFQESGKSSLLSYLSIFPQEIPLLLVHNTYTTKEDILEAERQHENLYWCFCPKANLYIENRLPEVLNFIDAEVKCTLGTDSLASNDTLSIWDEMKVIQRHFPSIPLEVLIKWATINGAELLGIENDYGSLESGKKADINWISKGKCEPLTFQEP